MTKDFQGISVLKMSISVLVLVCLVSPVVGYYKKPHIVMIVADDLGWDDVSFHGSDQIPTPTLDRLAKEGVILNNYYVSPVSTPSRAAFMTGKYASRLGVQHDTFHNQQPVGVPLTETFLPNRLRELGYSSHGIGKWHLGFFSKEYTPTYRGFDSFFGFWTNTEDYYSHVSYDNGYGLDLRRNLDLVFNESRTYSTELFTKEAKEIINRYKDGEKPLFLYVAHQAVHVGNGDDPLQVPEKYVKQFAGIKDKPRRKFAGMVTTLDESLEKITDALTAKGMMKDTIIVFTTDNGGAAGGYDHSAGSNYPLRGGKNTFWEGGVRGVGFVYSPLLKMKGRVCDELVHASDWLPTLYAAGGGNIRNLGKIDGYNVWEALSDGAASPRFEVLHGVDSLTNVAGALRVGDYKLIVNQDDSFYGDWYPRPGTSIPIGTNKRKRRQLLEGTTVDCTIREPHPLLFTHAPVCKPREKPCLFNIKWDPCEYHNIAEIMPNTMKVMLERFNYFANSSAQVIYPESDNSSSPDLHDGSWTFWRDNPKIPSTNGNFVYPDPMADLKMNNDGGSSSPFTPPDNEKIFKEKAKHVKPFANVTGGVLNHKPRNGTNIQKAAHHAPHHPKPPPPPPPPPPALPPPVYHVSSPKHPTKAPVLHPHVMQHHDKPRKPTVQRVRPNIVIEGIGNLIDANNTETVLIPNNVPYVPTGAPFFAAPTDAPIVPLPTESAINIDFLKTTSNPYKAGYFKTTDKPAIDIQNMLMEDLGSGMMPTEPPKQDHSAFKPVKVMKPLSLGDYVSGRPHEGKTHGSKTPGDKSLGAKLHSKEMKIDLPQVYDVIDETDNLPDNQGSKGTGSALNVYDVIDQKGTKATSNKNLAKKIESDAGSGVGMQSPLSTFFKPKPHADKPKTNFVPKILKVQTPGKLSPVAHNFEGDIIMDGHQFHIKGTETGDTEWLVNDARRQGAAVSDKPIVVQRTEHSTPKPKSNVPKKPAENEETVDSRHFSEVTDIIDETPEQDVVEIKQKPKHAPVVVAKKPKAKQVVVKPKQSVVKKPQPITSVPKSLKKAEVKVEKKQEKKEETKTKPLARVHANATDIAKKNDTNCEKPTQLESSDNAVVVSSVVIVVIASAMVVGVALVAMIAVVARHFQKPKNRDGAGTS